MAHDIAPFTRNENSLPVRMLRCVNVCFSRIYHQVDVHSPCILPRQGPAILVCNHLSGLDPVLLQAVSPRLIRWMMAREYYDQPGIKWICDQVGVISVNRGGRDMAATRAALAALEAGYVLGVFPEGKISPTNQLLPFQSGIALLASKSQAPIYPAYLEGTQRGKEMWQAYLGSQRASLAFGKPLYLARKQINEIGYDQATGLVWNAVDMLRIQEAARRNIQRQVFGLPAYSC